jgi:branched-subunit amino acid aminotransferase/4-amino-4-deoxychorismate lyase
VTTARLELNWIDGRLTSDEAPAFHQRNAPSTGDRGCFTTVRVASGHPLRIEGHVQRLLRDARWLGLPDLDPALCRRALEELARAAFPEEDGILRLQASPEPGGGAHLLATPRPLGPEPTTWRAITADLPHPGPSPFGGAKVTPRPHFERAAEAARRAGVEEAILFDAQGRLVEGTRTNLLLVLEGGTLVTPPLSRGAVAGIARELVFERLPALMERDVDRDAVSRAREFIATNAVRGAVPIVQLDGRPIADGQPGPFAEELATLREADDE